MEGKTIVAHYSFHCESSTYLLIYVFFVICTVCGGIVKDLSDVYQRKIILSDDAASKLLKYYTSIEIRTADPSKTLLRAYGKGLSRSFFVACHPISEGR